METFPALLAICAGNSLVTGEFPSQRPMTWSFDVFFAEFVKGCSEDLADVITLAFNYMIEQREFPGPWALGQRTPVFKNGCKSNADNYRGITILSIFAKIF